MNNPDAERLSYKCTSFQGASRDTNLHCSVSINLYLIDSDKDSHGLIRTMSYHSLKLPPEQTASKTAFLPLANNPSLEHSILHVCICCQSSHLGIFQVGTQFSFFKSFYGASVTKVGSVTARAVWVGDVHIYSLRDAAVTALVKSDTPKLLNALLVGVSLCPPPLPCRNSHV